MLRGEVGARALRVRSDVRGHGQVRLCKALGCGRCGCLKPIRACCVVGSAFFLVAPPRGGCAMAPRDSGMCWKQFMMCLEEIQFVAGVHSPPMHDPGLEEFQRPVRVCECKGASVLPYLLSCCCWRRRPPAGQRSRRRKVGAAFPVKGLQVPHIFAIICGRYSHLFFVGLLRTEHSILLLDALITAQSSDDCSTV